MSMVLTVFCPMPWPWQQVEFCQTAICLHMRQTKIMQSLVGIPGAYRDKVATKRRSTRVTRGDRNLKDGNQKQIVF